MAWEHFITIFFIDFIVILFVLQGEWSMRKLTLSPHGIMNLIKQEPKQAPTKNQNLNKNSSMSPVPNFQTICSCYIFQIVGLTQYSNESCPIQGLLGFRVLENPKIGPEIRHPLEPELELVCKPFQYKFWFSKHPTPRHACNFLLKVATRLTSFFRWPDTQKILDLGLCVGQWNWI